MVVNTPPLVFTKLSGAREQKSTHMESRSVLWRLRISTRCPPPMKDRFLKEERKLLETIAERIASCITHRRLLAVMKNMPDTQAPTRSNGHEWSAILDLLRCTDQSLLMRVSRKMINHLCWSGVKNAGKTPARFLPATGNRRPRCIFRIQSPLRAGHTSIGDIAGGPGIRPGGFSSER